ncbi:AfsR/SARP family transcriptional regulator [Verrucosispora sp. NA02020]|uniref:AfsR/SARP family transcriptional regulator n=2 Tax=Micromonospora TaxID=1873 RepID=UPI0010335FE4|nr:transcriptional regulator [Verrucosispora sp. SN26_14.1]
MQFNVLGPLTLATKAGPLPINGAKPRSLLSILLMNPGRTVATGRLIDGIWPTSPPASALHNVRTYVHRLRQLLQQVGDSADRLVRDGTGYRLRVEEDELDLLRFQRFVGQGHRAAREERLDIAVDLLGKALDQWHGHPLEDLPDLGTDVAACTVALQEQRRAAVTELIDVRLRLGQPAAVIPQLRRMVAEEPFDEPRQAQLVVALTLEGRVAEALAAYQEARRVIVDELGVDPGPTLQGALQVALDADSAEARPPGGWSAVIAGGPPPVAVDPPAGRRALPMKPPRLVGRVAAAHQLRAIADTLGADEHAAVVLVTGAPGVGKSSFAVANGYDLADLFPDGQLFVSFDHAAGTPRSTADLMRELLVELGVALTDVPEDVRERAAVLRCTLADRRLLLIIDDVDCAQQVRPLLPGAGRSLVLITSRQRLLDLDVGWRLSLGPLSRVDAVQLLATIAGEHRVREQPEVFGRIAAACDQLPLALRIVGSRIADQPGIALPSFTEQLEREENRLEELAVGDISVRHSLSGSYQSLTPQARAALNALATSDLLITQSSAGDILHLPRPQANRVVEDLVAHNLLVPVDSDGTGQRFHLPNLLRIFARECAAPPTQFSPAA